MARQQMQYAWGALRTSLASLALASASGLLLAPPFCSGRFGWLVFVGLIPWWLAARRRAPALELYLGAFAGGLLFHLWGLNALRSIEAGQELRGAASATLLFTAVFGACVWTFAFFIARLLATTSNLPNCVHLVIVWTSFEWLRSWLPWALFETPMPWFQLGLVLADHSQFVQIADITGVWGVSALVAGVNGWLIDVAMAILAARGVRAARGAVLRWITVAVAAVGLTWTYGQWRLTQPTPTADVSIGLAPFSFQPDALFAERLRAGRADVDVVLWPESSLQDVIQESSAKDPSPEVASLVSCARDSNAWLFVGCDRRLSDGLRRSTAVVDPKSNKCSYYDKVGLVPWSEFTPRFRVPGTLGESANYRRGASFPTWRIEGEDASLLVGARICYDVCFPNLFRHAGSATPHLFLVSSSEHSGRSGMLPKTMLRMAQFRAIETRRPMVRNVVHGFSGLVDSRGRFTQVGQGRELTRIEVIEPIPKDATFSIYSRVGDWLPVCCACCLAAVLFSGRLLNWRREPPSHDPTEWLP